MKNQNLGVTLVAAWLTLSATAFWWFEFKNYRAFSETTVLFDASEMAFPLDAPPRATVKIVHFWREGCFCNAPALAHLEQILMEFSELPVALYIIGEEVPTSGLVKYPYTVISKNDFQPLSDVIPSVPGLAVWTLHNELAYFGPYSTGPTCSKEDSALPIVLQQLAQNSNPMLTVTAGRGCFCGWSSEQG